jgi:hypothetical protein
LEHEEYLRALTNSVIADFGILAELVSSTYGSGGGCGFEPQTNRAPKTEGINKDFGPDPESIFMQR